MNLRPGPRRFLPIWMIQRRLMMKLLGGMRSRKKQAAVVFALFLIILVLTVRWQKSVLHSVTREEGLVGTESILENSHGSIDVHSLMEMVNFSSQQLEGNGMNTEIQGSAGFFRPWKLWYDTDGKIINAHGGSMLFVPSEKKYYWYGEFKEGKTYKPAGGLSRLDFVGIACYSSTDLLTWQNHGLMLPAVARSDPPAHDLHPTRVVERPRVLYNKKTRKYVMWVHVDNQSYGLGTAGVAVSSSPTGPFKYLGRLHPHNSESRDFTLFQESDGSASIVYSSEGNKVLHVSRLSSDYLRVDWKVKRFLEGQAREAPAILKHDGLYYMITSGCTGWFANPSMVHMAANIYGPWTHIGDMCMEKDKDCKHNTFKSQGTFVFPLPGFKDMFILMADMWIEHNLADSRYVWLPLFITKKPVKENQRRGIEMGVVTRWYDKWKLPYGWDSA